MNMSFQVRRITYVMATFTNCLRYFSRTRTHIVFRGSPAHQSSVCHRLSRTYQHVRLFSVSDCLERRLCIVASSQLGRLPQPSYGHVSATLGTVRHQGSGVSAGFGGCWESNSATTNQVSRMARH